MKLRIYNTLSRKLEEFIPINKDQIKMYVCGPTVYDFAHLGNARSVVVYDILYRLLRKLNPNVLYVRNITDVDDKINTRAKQLNISIQQLTTKTITNFHRDMQYLRCMPPTIEPKATAHIPLMIEIIQKLLDKGHAYVSNDTVYFSTSTFNEYCALSNRNLKDMMPGSRIEVTKDKKSPVDFVLWKPANSDDIPSAIFDSPWGKGKPGWHMECSAMSYHYLGTDFDIHGGGADLIFPHHTNEIAQSKCAFPGSVYAKYWIHNGFLTVDGNKMSKSLGNFIMINDLINKNIKGEVIRYFLLNAQYRKPLDFNRKSLDDAMNSLNYLYRCLGYIDNKTKETLNPEFLKILLSDLDTYKALGFLQDLAKKIHKTNDPTAKSRYANILKTCANFIGLLNHTMKQWFNIETNSNLIQSLIDQRSAAKSTKNWKLADEIRDKLNKEHNITLEDHIDGTTTWHKTQM